MPLLRVKSPGLFTTVQDRGRHGFRHIGVPTSGALDAAALRLANALVGNPEDSAGLECIGLGPELEAVDGPVRLAFVGDAPTARVSRADGTTVALPPCQTVTLAAGERLSIGPLRDSFSLCLAAEGGVDVPPVLGSRATYVRGGFGGFGGRPLRSGDLLPVGATASDGPERRLPQGWNEADDPPVRVVLGPQDSAFMPEALAVFVREPYAISASSDRMGFRLEGAKLAHRDSADIVSDGAVNGSIQVPGSGQPIVLLADGQTVGGYAKVATVIGPDLSRLVRRKPGGAVRFAAISQDDAEEAARDHARWLADVISGIEPFVDGLNVQALYDRNLVSGVTDAS